MPSKIHTVSLVPPVIGAKHIICSIVGLRPYRKNGLRIEAEKLDSKLVIHNYGHGGMGITLSWGSAYEVLALVEQTFATVFSSNYKDKSIAIIGGGIIGLTTAFVLASKGYKVRIYTRDISSNTTSAIAGGLWSIDPMSQPESTVLHERLQRTSYAKFSELALAATPLLRGVEFMDMYAFNDDPGLSSKVLTAGIIPPPEPITVSFTDKKEPKQAILYKTLRIDVPKYIKNLKFLIDTYKVPIIQKAIENVSQVEEPLVINCSGLGARELFDDKLLYPVRGQLIALKPCPAINYMCSSYNALNNSYTYMIPQSERIVIGGTYEQNNENLIIDEKITKQLTANAINFFLSKN